MDREDAKRLSQSLDSLPECELGGALKIDTFHHPYLMFPDSFLWPSIHVVSLRPDEVKQILSILKSRIPGWIQGCSILPENRPRKDSSQLQLVREYRIDEKSYIYILKISAEYMGGAEPDEIVLNASQGVTPSIHTDRIYYNARIVPVESLVRKDGSIISFEPCQVKDAIFQVSSRETKRDMWSTILFDEVDFSQVNERLLERFRFLDAIWAPRRHLYPAVIDYLTLCFNPVYPQRSLLDFLVPLFHRQFELFRDGKDTSRTEDQDQKIWHSYYQNWSYELDPSPSGNPHWRFNQYPDEKWMNQFV